MVWHNEVLRSRFSKFVPGFVFNLFLDHHGLLLFRIGQNKTIRLFTITELLAYLIFEIFSIVVPFITLQTILVGYDASTNWRISQLFIFPQNIIQTEVVSKNLIGWCNTDIFFRNNVCCCVWTIIHCHSSLALKCAFSVSCVLCIIVTKFYFGLYSV